MKSSAQKMPKYTKVELILFISVHQSTILYSITNKIHKYFGVQNTFIVPTDAQYYKIIEMLK